MIEEIADRRGDFGLQHVNHFIHDAHRDRRLNRLAFQRRQHVHIHRLARRVFQQVRRERHVNRRQRDLQPFVLEHVLPMQRVSDGEGDVRAVRLDNRDARPPLILSQPLDANPVVLPRQQAVTLHLIALHRQQRFFHVFRKNNQRLGGVADLIGVSVKQNRQAAGNALQISPFNPMARAAENHPGGVFQINGVRAGLRERDRRRQRGGRNRALRDGLIFQAHRIPAQIARLRGGVRRGRRQREFHRFARLAELRLCGQRERRASGLNQNFFRRGHAVRRAVHAQDAQNVAARLFGGRQFKRDDALFRSRVFRFGQLQREEAEIAHFAPHHRQLLRAEIERHARALHRLAARIGQRDRAAHRLAGLEILLFHHDVNFVVRLDVLIHPKRGGIELALIFQADFVAAGRRQFRQRETRVRRGDRRINR